MRKCPSPTGFFKIDNLFGELLTEAHKSIARKNLGIADENSLVWGNIKGQVGNQKDLREFINQVSQQETKKHISELMNISPETLTLVENLARWALEDQTGVAQMLLAINKNTQNIEEITKSTVYLTKEEYDALLKDNLIKNNVEYNIYEEE